VGWSQWSTADIRRYDPQQTSLHYYYIIIIIIIIIIILFSVAIQMTINELYFHWYLLFVVLIINPVAKTLVSDHSNESYLAVLSCGAVYYAVRGGSNF